MGIAFNARRLTPWGPDRLELGEGARWVGDRVVLVDIPTGRLLEADPAKPGPLRELAGLDACCEPVLDLDEVSAHPQVVARRLIENRTSGVEVRPAVLMRDDWRRRDAPRLGEHTAEVLRDVGVEEQDLERLRRQEVI